MALITRQEKGSKLTIAEMDGNLTYLEELSSGKYRLSKFPETVIPKTVFNESTVGKAFDLYNGMLSRNINFYETLENGTLVYISYNQSVLTNGVMIFEAYETPPNVPFPPGYIEGWWVAYKQDPVDSTKLIKVGEVKMTQQFWDNWYNWTAKDSTDNVVKFISTNTPDAELNELETLTTTVTYTGTGLTAVDSSFNYGGATVKSLYESLTGLTPERMNIQYYATEWILDDDYYGMAMGAEAGWYYYRNTSAEGAYSWFIVGFNLLTGATKAFNIVPALSTLTNWTSSLLDESKAPQQLVNHPNGICVSLTDGRLCDNGDNYDGVTAVWSPYWSGSNTEVIYIGARNQNTGFRDFVNGQINSLTWYWDNVSLYFFNYYSSFYSNQGYICYKYNTNTKETTLYEVPLLTTLDDNGAQISESYLQTWSNNDGIFANYYNFSTLPTSFSFQLYYYFKHDDSTLYSFHLDPNYPTHAFDDKIININTFATYNYNILGVPISTYKNMKF